MNLAILHVLGGVLLRMMGSRSLITIVRQHFRRWASETSVEEAGPSSPAAHCLFATSRKKKKRGKVRAWTGTLATSSIDTVYSAEIRLMVGDYGMGEEDSVANFCPQLSDSPPASPIVQGAKQVHHGSLEDELARMQEQLDETHVLNVETKAEVILILELNGVLLRVIVSVVDPEGPQVSSDHS
ncbi:hypothetical protein R1flu_007305 [Riccia fluitans]|uniref:Uncharacterized protein n=1 Tax=Riccia fluitans TaxID=41844 RepID=A0ABD1YZ19_9MARC